jgi:hypothetical protein
MTIAIEQEILKDMLNNPGDTFYESVLSDFLDEQGIEHDFRKPLHKEKIEELKLYQEKCLGIWANYWTNVGICTKPTDENKAEKYFYNIYKELGLEKFKSVIWINNPFEMFDQIKNQTRNQIWYQVVDQIWNKILDRVNDQITVQVRKRMKNLAWSQRQVSNQVKNQLLNHVKNYIKNHVIDQIWHGQQDVWRLAYYAYVMQVLRVEIPKILIKLMFLAQEVNWWFPAEETVYVVRKPKECIIEYGKFVKLVYQDDYTFSKL